jgi:hypothetical protein
MYLLLFWGAVLYYTSFHQSYEASECRKIEAILYCNYPIFQETLKFLIFITKKVFP